MIWGIKNGERIFANPLEKDAICPFCKTPLIAKCGEIKIWHWAHKNLEECDSFHEPETEWHLNWKREFLKDCQEIILKKEYLKENYGEIKTHIADIRIKDIIIEFQNSPLSSEQIKERENFYGKIKWVLNGKTYAQNLNLFEKDKYFSFKWKWFPKSWLSAKKPIYIDMNFLYEENYKKFLKIINKNDEDSLLEKERLKELFNKYQNKLFLIRKLYNKGNGWGKLISKEVFIKECEDGYYSN